MKVRKATVKYLLVLMTPMTVCAGSKFSSLVSLRSDSSWEVLVGCNKGGVPWGQIFRFLKTEASQRSRIDNCNITIRL